MSLTAVREDPHRKSSLCTARGYMCNASIHEENLVLVRGCLKEEDVHVEGRFGGHYGHVQWFGTVNVRGRRVSYALSHLCQRCKCPATVCAGNVSRPTPIAQDESSKRHPDTLKPAPLPRPALLIQHAQSSAPPIRVQPAVVCGRGWTIRKMSLSYYLLPCGNNSTSL